MNGLKTFRLVASRTFDLSTVTMEQRREQLSQLRDAYLQSMVAVSESLGRGEIPSWLGRIRLSWLRLQGQLVARELHSCVLCANDSILRVIEIDAA